MISILTISYSAPIISGPGFTAVGTCGTKTGLQYVSLSCGENDPSSENYSHSESILALDKENGNYLLSMWASGASGTGVDGQVDLTFGEYVIYGGTGAGYVEFSLIEYTIDHGLLGLPAESAYVNGDRETGILQQYFEFGKPFSMTFKMESFTFAGIFGMTSAGVQMEFTGIPLRVLDENYNTIDDWSYTYHELPEPSTMALAGLGILVGALLRRRFLR